MLSVPPNQPSESKSNVLFSACACHPCARAMLIFSVSFQSYWVISVEYPTSPQSSRMGSANQDNHRESRVTCSWKGDKAVLSWKGASVFSGKDCGGQLSASWVLLVGASPGKRGMWDGSPMRVTPKLAGIGLHARGPAPTSAHPATLDATAGLGTDGSARTPPPRRVGRDTGEAAPNEFHMLSPSPRFTMLASITSWKAER